jgi:hypothetical protein
MRFGCHFFSLLVLLTGCAQFQTGRTYLSDMGSDSQSFYNPHTDFPIVAGDNEDFGLSQDELYERAPRTEEEVRERRFRQILQEELHALESGQSGGAAKLYTKYKKKIGSTSERIYFLKLPASERLDYLEARGLLETAERAPASQSSQVGMGMTKDQVLGSYGKPQRIEIAGNPSYENERWQYVINGASKYIYFEAGRVEGWE